MKRIILIMMAIIMACPLLSQPVLAQRKTPLEKAMAKQYKTKMREFKKGGWELTGSSSTLEVALIRHYEKMAKDSLQEIISVADRFKSKNVGQQVALNNACILYARQAGGFIRGRIASDINYSGDNTAAEFDKMYAAYESLVQKEIKGELKPSFSVIKSNGDGTYSMQSFFLIDEEAASIARVRALERAVKETEIAQQYANKICDFVKEGFKIDADQTLDQ